MIGFLILGGGFLTGLLCCVGATFLLVKDADPTEGSGWGLVFGLFVSPIFGCFGALAAGVIYLLWHFVRWRIFDWPVAVGTLVFLVLSLRGWRYLRS
jgi:hypothetical protein